MLQYAIAYNTYSIHYNRGTVVSRESMLVLVAACMLVMGGEAVMQSQGPVTIQDGAVTETPGPHISNRTHIALHRQQRESNGNVSRAISGLARLARKKSIKNHIETMFNWKGKMMPKGQQVHPNISLPSLIPQSDRLPRPISGGPPVTDYTERVQSFFPECEVDDKYLLQMPSNQNLEVLFFKVKFPTPRPGAKLSVLGATLRLYKMSTGIKANCPQEHKQRITVSWLKLNKSRARQMVMLDSIMLPSAASGWTEFDVSGAVSHWHKRPRKPAAIVIEVEDSARLSVPTRNVVQPLNCTLSEGLKPTLSSGGIAARPAPRIQGGPSFSLNSDLHPLMDITTLEVPRGEDVPASLPFFGHNFKYNNNDQSKMGEVLPQPLPLVSNSLSQDRPPVRNVEIVHRSSRMNKHRSHIHASIASSSAPPPTQPALQPPDSHTFTLNKLEEIDYLGSAQDNQRSSLAPDMLNVVNRRPYGAGDGPIPVFQRVIMTKEDLALRLRELIEKQDNDRDSERRMLMQVVQNFMNDQ